MATDYHNADLDALMQARGDKFDEICSLLAAASGEDPDPNNQHDARKINQIIEEAEQLLKCTTVRGNWGAETTTKLQRLVDEHNEINKHIPRCAIAACEELTKRGVLVDSGKRDPERGEIMWTPAPDVRAELVKRGAWVDSGKRDLQTGEIIWAPNPNFTEEQLEALAEAICSDCTAGARRDRY